MMKKTKIFLLALPVLISVAVWLSPLSAFAATQEEQKRCNKFAEYFNFNGDNLVKGLPQQFCSLSDVATFALSTLLYLSGTVTILFLIVGGFFYVTAAGNEEQLEKGKKIIINAVIGLVVIVMATAIVKIVSSTLQQGGSNKATTNTTNTTGN